MTESEATVMGPQGRAKADLTANRYLVFKIADEDYGFEVLRVKEIISKQKTTHLPKSPDFIQGVVNLRGKIIPVVDLRVSFSLPPTGDFPRSCIVVTQACRDDKKTTMGILVDDVPEVLSIGDEQIESAPDFGDAQGSDYLLGIGRMDKRVIMLLDIDRIFTRKEMEITAQTAEEA